MGQNNSKGKQTKDKAGISQTKQESFAHKNGQANHAKVKKSPSKASIKKDRANSKKIKKSHVPPPPAAADSVSVESGDLKSPSWQERQKRAHIGLFEEILPVVVVEADSISLSSQEDADYDRRINTAHEIRKSLRNQRKRISSRKKPKAKKLLVTKHQNEDLHEDDVKRQGLSPASSDDSGLEIRCPEIDNRSINVNVNNNNNNNNQSNNNESETRETDNTVSVFCNASAVSGNGGLLGNEGVANVSNISPQEEPQNRQDDIATVIVQPIEVEIRSDDCENLQQIQSSIQTSNKSHENTNTCLDAQNENKSSEINKTSFEDVFSYNYNVHVIQQEEMLDFDGNKTQSDTSIPMNTNEECHGETTLEPCGAIAMRDSHLKYCKNKEETVSTTIEGHVSDVSGKKLEDETCINITRTPGSNRHEAPITDHTVPESLVCGKDTDHIEPDKAKTVPVQVIHKEDTDYDAEIATIVAAFEPISSLECSKELESEKAEFLEHTTPCHDTTITTEVSNLTADKENSSNAVSFTNNYTEAIGEDAMRETGVTRAEQSSLKNNGGEVGNSELNPKYMVTICMENSKSDERGLDRSDSVVRYGSQISTDGEESSMRKISSSINPVSQIEMRKISTSEVANPLEMHIISSSDPASQTEILAMNSSELGTQTEMSKISSSEPVSQTGPRKISSSEPVSQTEPRKISSSEPASQTEPRKISSSEPVSQTELCKISSSEPVSQTELRKISSSEPVSQIELRKISSSEPASQTELRKMSSSEPASQTELRKISSSEPASQTELRKISSSEPVSQTELRKISSSEPVSQTELRKISSSEPASQTELRNKRSSEPVSQIELRKISSSEPTPRPKTMSTWIDVDKGTVTNSKFQQHPQENNDHNNRNKKSKSQGKVYEQVVAIIHHEPSVHAEEKETVKIYTIKTEPDIVNHEKHEEIRKEGTVSEKRLSDISSSQTSSDDQKEKKTRSAVYV